MKIIVCGGGTGGHIYPALAIADEFKKRSLENEILYIGTTHAMESKIVPQYGYPYQGLDMKGLIRKISPENIRRLWKAGSAIWKARHIIKEFQPDLVVGTGGYVCGPVVYAAARMGCLTGIHEQNAFPGMTNRLLAPKVDWIFVGYEEARERFQNQKAVIYTGNPVRQRILDLNQEEARKTLGLPPEQKMLLVMAGSGGSQDLNDVLLSLIPDWIQKGWAFHYVTGRSHYETCKEKLESQGISLGEHQVLKAYEEDSPLYLAASDLVICSGGATTLAEVAAMGKASVVIPKAYTAGNHQEFNARILEQRNAGRCITENELNQATVSDAIQEIFGDEARQKQMQKNSNALFQPNCSEKIVDEILKRFEGEKP